MHVVWYAWPVSVIIASGLTYWLYRKQWQKSHSWKVASILRFLGLFLLSFWCFSPEWEGEKSRSLKPFWHVYVDCSYSDTVESQEKLDEVLKYLQPLNPNGVKIWGFANEVLPYQNCDSLNRNISRLDYVYQHIASLKAPSNLAVILSDGIVNKGRAIASTKYSRNIPVYSIGLGDTTDYPELELKSVLTNKTVFLGNSTEVEVRSSAINLDKKSANLDLLLDGKLIASEKWKIRQFQDYKTWRLKVNLPRKKGVYWLTARLKPIPGERNKSNNAIRVPIEVKEDKHKVHIVYHSPHPDIQAIKTALKGQDQYDIKTYSELEGLDLSADVYILHGVKSNTTLTQLKKAKKPVWYFVANEASVRNAINHLSYKAKATARNLRTFQGVTPLLNREFNRLDMLDSKVEYPWTIARSPLVTWKVPKSQVVLYQNWNGIATDYPLAFLQKNDWTSSWFLGRGIWRWRLEEFRQNQNTRFFDNWINQNLQFLSRASTNPHGIEILNSQHKVDPGEPVKLKFIYKDEAGNQALDESIKVKLIKNGKEEEIDFYIENKTYISNVYPPESGQFYVEIIRGEKERKRFDWAVNSVSLESRVMRANHTDLKYISNESNGLFLSARENLEKLTEHINKHQLNRNTLVVDRKWWKLEENAVFLLVLVVIFGSEWFLRKRLGRI